LSLKPKGDIRFKNDLYDAWLVRGQLAWVSVCVRRDIFCVLVCGKYVMFVYWDSDGVIVTRGFDYIKEPHFPAGFFWRYENLGRRQSYQTRARL
jgi:hypothetical protein